ncbi:GntR family transcriptional regulator [Paraferrimonas haliotis]|uniref:Methycitrate-responsive transcriptional regulator of methylisocitrate utilization PrpR n=1 Tax=Paraferrimonas haliotis TaxID=2013866 RepID=A0AA37TP64_9GAMM|nr:GntR family transcriptional regulator [Paraferrimonas haliotis]GLS82126.1 methycitrate-responsive transcriptional regulator of methylisocitrate utilization PrpR [Paraferrimonas haliotis]
MSQIIVNNSPITLADKATASLQQAIITGELEAGSKINEQALAAKYGISRGPLREALQSLQRQRLVVRLPHVGARVARMSLEELHELYELRAVLEGMACQLAAENVTPELTQQLQQLIQQQREQLTKGADFHVGADVDFHYCIIKASNNRYLQDSLTGGLYHLVRMYRFQCTGEQRPTKAIEEHAAIANAIISGDGELASLLMRRHIHTGLTNTASKLKNKIEQELSHD